MKADVGARRPDRLQLPKPPAPLYVPRRGSIAMCRKLNRFYLVKKTAVSGYVTHKVGTTIAQKGTSITRKFIRLALSRNGISRGKQ